MSGAQSELIEHFYAAFARRDGDAMAACYAPGVRFGGPVLGEQGSAHWIADYTFSATGRPVQNDVQARFRFRGARR